MGQIIILYDSFLWDAGFETINQESLFSITELIVNTKLRSLASDHRVWSSAFLNTDDCQVFLDKQFFTYRKIFLIDSSC